MSQQARPAHLKGAFIRSSAVSLLPALLLAGGLLRLAVAWRDLDVLDTWFFPDDTYLSLGVARNIALGFGSTFDRYIPTNGYQPLYVWLMVPVYWLFPVDRVVPIHIALTLLVLASVATGWFVYRIVRRLGQPWHALVACAVWMLDPVVFTHSMNGLETGIALLGIAATADWYLAHVRSRSDVPLRALLVLGLLSGITILARIDQCLLLAALGIDLLLERPRWRTLRQLAFIGCVVLLVTLPWLLFSWSIGAGPIPESGAAVRFHAQAHAQWFGPHLLGGWYGWTLLRSLGVLLLVPRSTVVLVWFALLIALLHRLRKQPNQWVWTWLQRVRPLRFATVYCAMLFLAYWLLIPAAWFFERYWQPIALFALLATVLMLPNADDLPLRLRWGLRTVVLVFLLFEAAFVLRFLVIQPEPNGYRSIALWVDRNLAGATVGAFQSGALGYWAERVRVVNLDGVVDRTSLQARREGRTMDQLRRRQVDWLLDWTERPGMPVDGDLSAVKLQYQIPDIQTWDLRWYLFRVHR